MERKLSVFIVLQEAKHLNRRHFDKFCVAVHTCVAGPSYIIYSFHLGRVPMSSYTPFSPLADGNIAVTEAQTSIIDSEIIGGGWDDDTISIGSGSRGQP